MQSSLPKQYLDLRGRPLALHSFETLKNSPLITDLIVICEEAYRSLFPGARFASPGERRQDSVFNGLQLVTTEFVCIHDSARPFLHPDDLESVLLAAKEGGAATLALPVQNTIKESDSKGFIQKNVPREKLWEMQTPQVCRTDLLKAGYALSEGELVTDDNSLVQLTGHPIRLVKGRSTNFKVTTPEDLLLAHALL
ncbi:MAG: 2-C-methyl-D-erythritol 4-phosphate cytidylyltransferase [Verrucomicrobia bacterium]|nr:2-C-methyl-D-erythritol 4-phosphate cytidylyltransferase [Verrucomicrobiota bacterium]